ncbi:MAG: HlyD family secretion protein [Acidobacteria bacterium]|nr:HlyD family secretion protein [Acidobacteriota bacterium]
MTQRKLAAIFTFRRILIALLVIAGAALLAAFARGRKKDPVYFTAALEKGDIHSEVNATGTINAVTTVQVGSQVSGVIDKLYVDFNSRVKTGMIVAQIEQSIFKAQLQQAEADVENALANQRALAANIETMKADLASAEANVEKAAAMQRQAKLDLDRNADLFKQGIVAAAIRDQMQSTYDTAAAVTRSAKAMAEQSRTRVQAAISQLAQAKAQVEQRRATLDLAKVNLAHTIIYAPIDGTVVARNVDVGQTVAASFQAPTLFTIAQDLTKMLVYAKTDESDVGNIREGARARFKVDAFPKETFFGRVAQIRINPQTVQNVVTYDTVIEFDNPDQKLLPGMTAYVTIPVAEARNALKIPNGALRYRPEEPERKALMAKFQMKDGGEGRPGMAPSREGGAGGPGGGGMGAGMSGGKVGGGSMRGVAGGMGGGMGAGMGGGRPGGASDIKTIYVLQPDKQLRPVVVKLGITDFTFTEMAGLVQGELNPGEEVVTGKELPNRGMTGFGPGMGGGGMRPGMPGAGPKR